MLLDKLGSKYPFLLQGLGVSIISIPSVRLSHESHCSRYVGQGHISFIYMRNIVRCFHPLRNCGRDCQRSQASPIQRSALSWLYEAMDLHPSFEEAAARGRDGGPPEIWSVAYEQSLSRASFRETDSQPCQARLAVLDRTFSSPMIRSS
jgi:hypothetical protein